MAKNELNVISMHYVAILSRKLSYLYVNREVPKLNISVKIQTNIYSNYGTEVHNIYY